MYLKILRTQATFLLLAVLILPATAAQAQPPQLVVSKLDALLSARVLAGDSGTERVIIRTTSDGIPGLTTALEASGNPVLLVHPMINALTARVPVAALQGISHLPFVVSISIDAIVLAEATSTEDSTLRGTLGLPVQSPTGNRVGVAVIDSGLEAGPEFDDRIGGFYDFTRAAAASLQTITATNHVASRSRRRDSIGQTLPRSGTEGAAHRAQGSESEWRGQYQRRDQRDRIRDDE
jgi:hypothetical protein